MVSNIFYFQNIGEGNIISYSQPIDQVYEILVKLRPTDKSR